MNKLHMKTNGLRKIIEIIIAVGFLAACDVPSTLLVNNAPTYCTSTQCGAVKIKGATLFSDRIMLIFAGDFMVNIDSLKLKANNVPIENKNVDVFYRSKLLEDTNRTIQINGNDTISLIIKNKIPIKYGKNSYVEITPSSFILCNGKSLITNTIKILKQR